MIRSSAFYKEFAMDILSEIFESLRNYKDEAIGFNQKGYVGQSMSVRAKQAYDDGEMPRSKWSKAATLDALAEEFGDEASSGFNHEELNDFYNDLKNKKETDKTKYIYNTFAYISSMSQDSDGKSMIYKDFNIKQL